MAEGAGAITESDRELLRRALARRHRDLLPKVDELGERPLSGRTLVRLREALVDEELDGVARDADEARRMLELEERLARL